MCNTLTENQARLATRVIRNLVVQGKVQEHLAQELGLNSANLSLARSGKRVTPLLYDKLAEAGYVPERPLMVEVPACPNCGQAHSMRKCRRRRKPRRRFMVPLNDPAAALEALEQEYPGMFALKEK